MSGISRRYFIAGSTASVLAASLAGCDRGPAPLPISLTIDWVPSAEYYGFFVANATDEFRRRDLIATIVHGSGAPAVAAQIAAQSISFGTTTSDNLVRILARGAQVHSAIPILPYNPTTLIMRPEDPPELRALAGKRVGVNIQSATYTQFQRALVIAGVATSSFTEYPIGFGGVDEFADGRIDALLGWTSNHSVDLALRNIPFREIPFDQLGISSAGLVLVVSQGATSELETSRIEEVVDACLAGYSTGANDVPVAVRSLRAADPTLDARKLQAAIQKAVGLTRPSQIRRWDEWLRGQTGISNEAIERTNALLTAGYRRW